MYLNCCGHFALTWAHLENAIQKSLQQKIQIKSCNFQIYGLSTNTILEDLTCVFNEAFIVLYSKSIGGI